MVNNIVAWGQNIYNTAIEWISNTINSIVNWFSQLPSRIMEWLYNTINNIVNWGNDMSSKGKQAAQDLSDNIVNTIKELPSKMLEIGKNIVQGLIDGIKNMASNAGQAISNFGSGLVDGLKSKLGIHSPSKVFRDEIGKFIPQGLAVGIEADTDKALKAIDNMNDEIYSKMQNAVARENASITAKATLEANNSMLNVIQANFNIDGSIDIDGQKAGRILAPNITKTIKAGGLV